MRFRYSFFLVVCIFLLGPKNVFGQFYPAKTYSTTNGMPSNSVYSITQADNKVMWFVTSKGVATYDASEWHLFPDSLELPFTEHSYIKNDDQGRIWVAGYNKSGFTIQFYENKEWTKIITPQKWPGNRKVFSFTTANGQAFLGLNNQLFYLNSDYTKWKLIEIADSDEPATINSLVDIDNELYIATKKGIFVFDNDTARYSELNEYNLPNENILTINKHGESFYFLGLNWIGKTEKNDFKLISDELGIFSESSFKKYSLEIDDRERVYYSSYSMASVVNEETGKWIPLKVLGRQQNLLSNQIFVDAENNYWVGDNRGLFKFNLLRFKNFNSNTNLLEDEVSGIYETSDGRILLANPRGLNFYSEGSITSIDLRDRYPDYITRILDLEQDSNGRIFIALSGGGLASIKNGQVREYDSQILNDVIIALCMYKGELLVANKKNVFAFRDGKLELFAQFKGIRNIVTLSSGKLAILSTVGIQISDGINTEEYYSTEKSLNSTFDIVEWKGKYLVATEAGLAVLEENKIINYDKINVDRNYTYSLLIDSGNELWIGTNDGVYKTDGTETVHYNKRNGLIGNEINRNALIEDSDKNIWIGTDAGVSVFDKGEEVELGYTPNIELKEFKTLNGTDLSGVGNKSIGYKENSLELKFRTVSFFNEDEMSFQYKLEGFEKDWNQSSNISSSPIRYTNLSPGNYTLHVKGRVESKDWSDPYLVNFVIEKPFYQQIWFVFLVIILLSVIVYMIHRIRVLFLVKQRENLKRLVSRRTQEIDTQNSQLKNAYKDLERAQLKIVQTEKMAALGTLTAGVAHEINNPLNYIKSGKAVLKNLTEEDADKIIIKDKSGFNKVMKGIDLGVDKILKITRSLGSFSSSDTELRKSIHLNKVIKDSITIHQHELKDRITLKGNYNSDDKYVSGNESKLYQIISNLLTNSIQAINNEGTIKISLSEEKAFIILEIKDDGAGIPEEILSKVYDPFFTTKEQGKGTGLGLTIVYNMVEELDGTIEILSTLKEGTTVKVKLLKSTKEDYG